MKKAFSLMLVLLVGIFLAVGCGDDDDDKDDSGSPTGGGSTAGSLTTHQGANAAVTQDNVQTVSSEINAKAWDVFGRALSTAQVGKIADYTTKLAGDVQGRNSGKATVAGNIVTKLSGQMPSTMNYNFTCTYFDFSDDGHMFLGGKMTYTGAYNYTNQTYNIDIYGDMRFNGDYEGSQKFNTTINMNATTGTTGYTVTTETTSGGQTFTNTFNY